MEGRPNAGFVVTTDGVVVIDALASPRQGEQLLRTIRGVTDRPIAWLVLTHHHPDHHFGAVVLRKAGARVIAHPDKRVLASEGGEDALIADWVRVVGLDAMRGFEFADTPDRPVTASDTLRLGGKTIVVIPPGPRPLAGRPSRLAPGGARSLRGGRPGGGRREHGRGRELDASSFARSTPWTA